MWPLFFDENVLNITTLNKLLLSTFFVCKSMGLEIFKLNFITVLFLLICYSTMNLIKN